MNARGTFIGFATASEKTSAASHEGSPYTLFLVKNLATPGLSILDMHTQVTAQVQDFTKATGAEQVPYSYSGLRSPFFFVERGSNTSAPAPSSAPFAPHPSQPPALNPQIRTVIGPRETPKSGDPVTTALGATGAQAVFCNYMAIAELADLFGASFLESRSSLLVMHSSVILMKQSFPNRIIEGAVNKRTTLFRTASVRVPRER